MLAGILSLTIFSCATGGGVLVVRKAPPPPRHEVVVVKSKPGAVWVPGHWQWNRKTRSLRQVGKSEAGLPVGAGALEKG